MGQLLYSERMDRPVGKNLRIALISLYILESNGIRYLSASLRRAGFHTDEIFLGHFIHHHQEYPGEATQNLLISLLRERKPDLVGMSVRAGAYLTMATELTERIRDQVGVPVLWGGAHVTLAPEQCFQQNDFLLLGEAEKNIVGLAEALETGEELSILPGVWMRRDGREIRNPVPPLIQNLDDIPFPDFTSTESKFWIHNGKVIPGEPLVDERIFRIMASRGCPFNCSFCGVSAFRRIYSDTEGFYRVRSVENVIQELEQAKTHFPKLHRIRFDDELFVPNKTWITEFVEQYKKRIGMPFDILSNPRCLDSWTIATLTDAGMDSVFLGVQGIASSNVEKYKRYVADQRVIDVARAFKKRQIRGMFQVLIDDPLTTREEQHMLLELLLNLPRPFDLYIYSLCHWPSSARTEELLEKGLISEQDVEGCNDKVFRQFNADFTHPRSPENNLYLALYILSNKRGIPRPLLRWIDGTPWFFRHPKPVMVLAIFSNMAKIFVQGAGLALKGELSMHTVRRWLQKQNPFTLPSV